MGQLDALDDLTSDCSDGLLLVRSSYRPSGLNIRIDLLDVIEPGGAIMIRIRLVTLVELAGYTRSGWHGNLKDYGPRSTKQIGPNPIQIVPIIQGTAS